MGGLTGWLPVNSNFEDGGWNRFWAHRGKLCRVVRTCGGAYRRTPCVAYSVCLYRRTWRTMCSWSNLVSCVRSGHGKSFLWWTRSAIYYGPSNLDFGPHTLIVLNSTTLLTAQEVGLAGSHRETFGSLVAGPVFLCFSCWGRSRDCIGTGFFWRTKRFYYVRTPPIPV
jgi:hypothetical protein